MSGATSTARISRAWRRSCASTAATRSTLRPVSTTTIRSRPTMPRTSRTTPKAGSSSVSSMRRERRSPGLDLGGFTAAEEASSAVQYRSVVSPHLGLGVRRAVSANGDLGVRAEFDDFHGALVGLRVLDYRYRLDQHLCRRRVLRFCALLRADPGVGLLRGRGTAVARPVATLGSVAGCALHGPRAAQQVLPSDPQNGDPVEWYTMQAPTLYLSRHF
jgi:hypothetical protein